MKLLLYINNDLNKVISKCIQEEFGSTY